METRGCIYRVEDLESRMMSDDLSDRWRERTSGLLSSGTQRLAVSDPIKELCFLFAALVVVQFEELELRRTPSMTASVGSGPMTIILSDVI